MLIDLHAHSSGISKCCRIDAEEVVREAVRIGLDGICLLGGGSLNLGQGEIKTYLFV